MCKPVRLCVLHNQRDEILFVCVEEWRELDYIVHDGCYLLSRFCLLQPFYVYVIYISCTLNFAHLVFFAPLRLLPLFTFLSIYVSSFYLYAIFYFSHLLSCNFTFLGHYISNRQSVLYQTVHYTMVC